MGGGGGRNPILEASPLRTGEALQPSIYQVARPIKVLVIIPNLDIGGAEMDLVRNLPLLEANQFTPVVFTLFGEGPLSKELRAHDIEIVSTRISTVTSTQPLLWGLDELCRVLLRVLPSSLMSRRLASIQEYIRLATSIARYVNDANIDVLHAILPSAYLAATLANALTLRRPLIMSRVSLNWYHREARVFASIERRCLHPRAQVAIANSQAVLAELRDEGIPDHKLRLIHNGIDATAFENSLLNKQKARTEFAIAPNALVFSSVGNLFPYKGHADLLYALSLIKDRLPDPWFLLVAGRDVRGSLHTLLRIAADLGLSQNVRLLGQRGDVPAILSATDIHVSASHHEGFPNNILEAMSARLPVVATAVGGVPEQVVDGQTGILVPAHNPARLSSALLALARQPDLRTIMGIRGRKRVEVEFPIAPTVRALGQIYSAVTGRRRHCDGLR